MGQKINPYAWRLGINQVWKSRYIAPKKEEAEWFRQDELIRDYIFSHFTEIVSVEIERTETELVIYIYISNSSLINEKNENSLNQTLARLINNKRLSIKTYFKLDQDSAQALASNLARQLENNVNWKQACQEVLSQASRSQKNKGVKLEISGRLNRREIAETKKTDNKRSLSSSSIISLICFGETEAKTSTGKIGITVQISKKEEHKKKKKIKYVNP